MESENPADGFRTEILDIRTGQKRRLPLADANISADGNRGVEAYYFLSGYCGFFDTQNERVSLVLQEYSYKAPVVDIRCDLHARWSRDGSMISYDMNHGGRRGIVLLQAAQFL